jgi:hypothetical protein
MQPSPALRLEALDLLRGYFIIVVIVDHMYRWPSIMGLLGGQGGLWVSAAEGFFIVSGFLIGYIRGHRQREVSMAHIAKRLASRALLLYVWSVLLTVFMVGVAWYAPYVSGTMPYVNIPFRDWPTLLWQAVSQQYVFTWVYFLRLYWIMLLLAIPAVYALRHHKTWVVVAISSAAWILGFIANVDWLQWQWLFFVAAAVGANYPTIESFFMRRSQSARTRMTRAVYFAAIASVIASVITTFYLPFQGTAGHIATWLLTREPLAIGRMAIAALWFAALYIAASQHMDSLQRIAPIRWIKDVFGRYSLTAYILHGFVLLATQLFAPTTSYLTNSLLGLVAIVVVWCMVWAIQRPPRSRLARYLS